MSVETIECKSCSGSGQLNKFGKIWRCETCGGTGRVPLPLNPWTPISDAMDLKHLGKLAEECGELNAAIARCIIQGTMGREPITGKLNLDWLQNEIADVLANIDLVAGHFKLSGFDIDTRRQKKTLHLRAWHAMTGEEK